MKVIVTGANGFIGTHCVEELTKAGNRVYALCHKTPNGKLNNVEYMQIDLFDRLKVNSIFQDIRATHMLHLAWYVNPIDYRNSLGNIKWLDVSMSMMESFVKYGGSRIVTAGSCLEYDWEQIDNTSKPINENFPKNNGETLYGACKLALGNICAAYMKEKKLSAAHGRIFYLFGPHENFRRLIPFAMNSFMDGKTMELKHGAYIRDYLYVKDVAAAFLKLLDSDFCGSMNIASGEGMRLRDLLESVEKYCSNGQDLIRTAQENAIFNEPIRIVANNKKLKSIGWERKYPLDIALRNYSKWMTWKRVNGDE